MECVRLDLEMLLLQMVNENAFFARVHNPVFPNTCVCVQVQLENIVMA